VQKRAILAKLKAELWKDLEARQLEAGKPRGTISRRFYQRMFGFTKTVGSEAIFDEMDAEVRKRLEREKPSFAAADNWLQERRAEGSLNLTRGKKILRRQFCDAFGMPFSTFEKDFPEFERLLCEWDLRLASQGYKHDIVSLRHEKVAASRRIRQPNLTFFVTRGLETSLKVRLSRALQHDYEHKCIVLTRPGVISRKHYADQLSTPRASLVFHIGIFRHYEALLVGEEIPYEAQIDAMEHWLRQQIENGSIRIIGRLFARSPFLEHFGLNSYAAHRNPFIREMWRRVEADIASGKIKSKAELEQLASVRNALAEAPLNPDGLKINKPFVARQAQVSEAKLRQGVYQEALKEEENLRFAEMLRDPLRAYIFGKVYDFRPLLALGWDSHIVAAIRNTFVDASAGRDAVYLKGLKGYIFGFLSALANGSSAAARESFTAINARRDFSHAVWNAYLSEFNQSYVGEFSSNNTKEAYLGGINVVLSTLGAAGILPKTNILLKIRPKGGGHINNFAEILPVRPVGIPQPRSTATANEHEHEHEHEPIYEEHIRYAKWRMLQSRRPGDPVIEVEDQAFFASLRQELQNHNVAVPNDPVEALSQILELRINRLKRSLVSVVSRWREHYFYGQELLANGALADDFLEKIEPENATGRPRPYLRSLFPDEADSLPGLANFLQFIAEQHNGVVPSPKNSGLGASFFCALSRAYGGISRIQAYLIPHRSAVAASICLYLLESGANVAVGRTLNTEAIEISEEPGFVKVTGEKARAHGKPIIVDLPESSEAIQAMRWLREELRLARAAAPEEVKGLLFVRRCGDAIVEVTGRWLWAWFKEFLKETEDLSDLPLSVNMTRPSVMLLHALRNDGNQRNGVAYAQHGENVAGIYQVREGTKYLFERKWREFNQHIETLAIYRGKAAKALLGIDEATNEIRVAELKRTGLGGYCLIGGCESMRCHSCPKFAIIAYPEDIADLQIWNESLREVEGEWIRDRVERWEAEWLEWHCFTEVLAEKMREGTGFRRIWREATKIAELRKAQPDFAPPRPY